jgi:hypothetical protein
MPQPYPNGELVLVIDCSDLDVSARFWCGVLGYTAGPPAAGTGEAGSDRYRGLQPDSGAGIDVLLQRVPDVKGRRTGCIWTCAHPTWTPRSGACSTSGRGC